MKTPKKDTSRKLSDADLATAARRRLLAWFRRHGRSFWWRDQKNPYVTLLVEILLRQTRAISVVDEIALFVSKYPNPESLAQASRSSLTRDLRIFGLQRQRASQLKALGKALIERGGGVPSDKSSLASLPGVGPYATSAVRCFAFGIPEPVIDVNSARIVERVFGLEINRGEPRKNKEVKQLAHLLVKKRNTSSINWALLDLGALVCTSTRPQCGKCPLQNVCLYRSLIPAASHA